MEKHGPNKEALRTAVGERLITDHVLTGREVESMAGEHGYRNASATDIMHPPGMRRTLAVMKIELVVEKHRKTKLYINEAGPEEEIEQALEAKKAEIDTAMAAAHEKTRQTRAMQADK